MQGVANATEAAGREAEFGLCKTALLELALLAAVLSPILLFAVVWR